MTGRVSLFRLFKGALFVLVALLLMPQPGYRGAPAAFLDTNQYAVDLASLSGQVDPQGTVFGLGRLARLATRAPGLGHGVALAFDLLVAVVLIYALLLVFRRARSLEALLGILAAALLLEGVRSYVFPLAVVLWLALLVVALDYMQRGTWLSLLIAAGLSWSLFYLQSSVGLAALLMLAAVLLFRLVRPDGRSRRFTTLALAAWLLLGVLMGLALRVDLPEIAANALRLRGLAALSAPALAIGKASGSEFLLLAATILVIFAGVLVASRRALRDQASDWLACALAGALLLLAFREAFVRPWGHPWLFFQAAAAAVGILALFLATEPAARRFGGAFIAVLILSFPAVSANVQGDYVAARIAGLRSYAAWTLNRPADGVRDERLDDYLLPPRVAGIIGDGTVDASAHLLPVVVANELAFQPSPALPSLADLPGEIGSGSGPRFIILGLDDDLAHNPFPAGSPARLDLLRNYRIIWVVSDSYVVLEKLPQPRPLAQDDALAGNALLGEPVALESPGGIKQLRADVELSPAGRIMQSAVLTPPVDLVVEYADGQRDRLQLTAEQLRTGVQLAPVVNELADFELFSVTSGRLNRPVARFWLKAPEPWAFRPQFSYTVDSYTAANTAAQEWPIVSLPDGHQVQLRAVQYDPEARGVALDTFWQVDPQTFALDPETGPVLFARLLDGEGNVFRSAEVELRDRAPGLRILAEGPNRYLAAGLRVPLPPETNGAVYDLQIGLAPAGQSPDSATWSTLLPGLVQTLR